MIQLVGLAGNDEIDGGRDIDRRRCR